MNENECDVVRFRDLDYRLEKKVDEFNQKTLEFLQRHLGYAAPYAKVQELVNTLPKNPNGLSQERRRPDPKQSPDKPLAERRKDR